MGILGFFRKVTGGTANVTLNVGTARRGGKAPVTIDVSVQDEPVAFKRVYVTLRCKEEVDIPKYTLPQESGAKTSTPAETPKPIQVKAEEVLFEKEFVLASSGELAANAKRKFEGEIELPGHLPPSFNGKLSRVKWHAQAGLATSLTDPATDWQEIAVA